MALDFLTLGEELRIRSEHFDEGVNLRFGSFAELDEVVGLFGGEEMECVNAIVRRVHAVYSPHALNEASGIPRDVVIQNDICPVERDALGEDFGGDQDAVVVGRPGNASVEIADDLLAHGGIGIAGENDDLFGKFASESGFEIQRSFLRLSEKNNLSRAKHGVSFDGDGELFPLWIAIQSCPCGAYFAQDCEVALKVTLKGVFEIGGQQFFGEVCINQLLNTSHVLTSGIR